MTKLCPRGKAAAKRKFKVYPSAYANAYASKICAGKIKDPSGVKRKDFRGPKPSKAMGGRIFKSEGGPSKPKMGGRPTGLLRKAGTLRKPKETMLDKSRKKEIKMAPKPIEIGKRPGDKVVVESTTMGGRKIKKLVPKGTIRRRENKMGGGMMRMPRAMYKKGGKSFPDLSGDGKVTMKDILMGRGVIQRPKKKGGGLMEATSRLRAQGLKMGGIARGCGAVMSDRRKKTKMY